MVTHLSKMTKYYLYYWDKQAWKWKRVKTYLSMNQALKDAKLLDDYKRKIIEITERTVLTYQPNEVANKPKYESEFA